MSAPIRISLAAIVLSLLMPAPSAAQTVQANTDTSKSLIEIRFARRTPAPDFRPMPEPQTTNTIYVSSQNVFTDSDFVNVRARILPPPSWFALDVQWTREAAERLTQILRGKLGAGNELLATFIDGELLSAAFIVVDSSMVASLTIRMSLPMVQNERARELETAVAKRWGPPGQGRGSGQASRAMLPPAPVVHRDSSAAAVIRIIQQRGVESVALFLRDSNQVGRRAVLDSVADALVAMAIADSGRSPLGRPALSELRNAITPNVWMPGPPYAGGTERLIRIHKEKVQRGVREVALQALAAAFDQMAAVAYLREVAVDPESDAPHLAIWALKQAFSIHGSALAGSALRELWEKKLVKGEIALQSLEDYARAYGWIRP